VILLENILQSLPGGVSLPVWFSTPMVHAGLKGPQTGINYGLSLTFCTKQGMQMAC